MKKLNELIDTYLNNKAIEEAEEADAKNKERMESGELKFYPSSIGKCPRAIVYGMLGYPQKPKNAKTKRVLENGDYVHMRFQNLLVDMGLVVANEYPLKNEELCISGRLDTIVQIDDELAVVEFKSAKDNSFKKMKNARQPYDEYIMQIQLYLHLTGINKGFILIENKNDQEMFCYPLEYDEEMAREVIEKIELCVGCARRKELPERPGCPEEGCKWCDFGEECWSDL